MVIKGTSSFRVQEIKKTLAQERRKKQVGEQEEEHGKFDAALRNKLPSEIAFEDEE